MFYQNNNDYMRDAFFYSTPQNSTYANGCSNGFSSMNNTQTPMFQNAVVPTNTMGNNTTMNNTMMNNTMMNNTMGNNMMNNQMNNTMGNNMMNNQMNNQMMSQPNMQRTSVSSMYPQVYRIINPVANRVISNSNYQFLTEDTLDNMVDTVYNIVEGDVSTLSSTTPTNSGDDTVTQGPARGSTQTATATTSSNSNGSSRQTTMAENSRSSTTTVISRNNNSNNSNNRGENQLLRDLIKIIIIKELLSRQFTGFAMENTSNNQMNNSNFMGNTNNPNNFYDPRMFGLI